jgi:hypothetical protein
MKLDRSGTGSTPAGVRTDLIGRRVGEEIVQYCLNPDRPEKWVFSEITARTFLWRAFLLADDGITWRIDSEFHLQRTAFKHFSG